MRATRFALACSLAAFPAMPQAIRVDPAQELAAGAAAEKAGAYAEALRQYTLGAQAGDAACMNALGDLHYDGHGVPQSYAQALAWYRRSAAKGFAKAQSNLGFCAANGLGGAKDMAEAVRWYRLAADQGYPNAQNNLAVACLEGTGVARNPAEAEAWFLKAAQQGYARAQRNLGTHYWSGTFGPKDPPRALAWFQKAADQGDAFSMDFAAYLLSRARNTPPDMPTDPKAAYRLYLKAALQGFVDSQLVMGDLCREGRMDTRVGYTTLDGLLKEDLAQARDWYAKAAAQGSGAGHLWLGHLAAEYKVPAHGGAVALRAYQAATEAGDLRGYHHLTLLLRRGDLVPKDEAQALAWAVKGARQGDADSWNDLQSMLYGASDGQALQAFETLAREGQAKAAYHLGLVYLVAMNPEAPWARLDHPRVARLVKTLGVRGDLHKAFAFFLQAAKGGERNAYRYAATAYEEGLGGVAVDAAEAARWKSLH